MTTAWPLDQTEVSADDLLKRRRDLNREQAILVWAQEQYKRCKNQRSTVERQWYMNLAFYFGRQNVQHVRAGTDFKLVVPKAPPWRVRMVINKIRPIIRTELAKVTSERPRFTVVPATNEDEDHIAARVSEQIFDVTYSEKNVKHIVRRAMWWTLICGSGFMKSYWDSNAIDKVSKQRGDFTIEPVTPFHMFVPDLKEEELENQPYIIHASTKNIVWIKNVYPFLRDKDLTATASVDDILDSGFLGMIGAQSGNSREETLVLEFWVKPGTTNILPNGGLITIVGDHVVQVVDKYPYEHGEYPFVKMDHIPTGKFYGESIVTDLIPLQREYNRTRSQIIEAKNLMGKPKLMAPRGSINPNQITSEPGQVILYTPGFNPPTPLDHAPLPSYVMNEVQQLQVDMDDMAGQHEISRGQNPSQVTAATALSFLKEQDDTKLAGTIESLETAMEKLGRLILGYVAQFWTTPRLVRVVGRDGTFDAQMYKGKDLKGNLDVRVESGSALPQSKAAKQAFVMDLMKMGFIPPERGLEMMNLGGVEKVYDEYLVDVRQAQRENIRMANGQEIMANDFDNHEVHMEVHNKFRKGQEYEALDEQVQMIFNEHVASHMQAMASGLMPGGVQLDPATGQPVGNTGAPPPTDDMMGTPTGPPDPTALQHPVDMQMDQTAIDPALQDPAAMPPPM